jgi:hypothetical protein
LRWRRPYWIDGLLTLAHIPKYISSGVCPRNADVAGLGDSGLVQQFVSPLQQRHAVVDWRGVFWVPSFKLSSAMLASQLSSQIFDLDVQRAAASWAFLNEIGTVLHVDTPL